MADFSGFFKKQSKQKKKGWDEQDQAKFRSTWSGKEQYEEAAKMEDDKKEGGFFQRIKSRFKK